MIEIKTLGRTAVAVSGVPLAGEAAWPKSLALIVYMAREPGPDRREEILGVLWPDLDEKHARRALNQLIYTLRKTSPELDLESVSDALDFGKEVWLDVEEFERRLEAGDLEGAVGLYEGPFLDDLSVGEPEFDHWADRERAGLGRKFRRAALELASQAKAAGDVNAATVYCRRLVEADPLDDEAQHLLIECLYLRGDRLAALRQYDRYKEILARELEVEPLDHTRELVETIRGEPGRGESAREAVVEAGTKPAEERQPQPQPEAAAATAAEAEQAARRAPIVQLLGRRNLLGLAGIVVVVAAAIWLWPWSRADGPVAASGGTVAAGSIRVAVLPFRPHGLGSDDAGLSEGVAQLLSLNLGEMTAMSAVDHRSVLQHWEASDLSQASALNPGPLSSLADALGATTIVLGDVHASGEELRIVADLVDARSGALLARADVRGSRDGLFDLLEALTLALASEMGLPADSSAAR
ncbi:MAG: BTAD domain-containing putative transcriptional regulator [Gemmatimonadota bacterium]